MEFWAVGGVPDSAVNGCLPRSEPTPRHGSELSHESNTGEMSCLESHCCVLLPISELETRGSCSCIAIPLDCMACAGCVCDISHTESETCVRILLRKVGIFDRSDVCVVSD